MTIHALTARRVVAAEHGGGYPLKITATISEGIKPAIGRRVEMQLTGEDLAFVLAELAARQPAAVRALADALDAAEESYGPPPESVKAHDPRSIERMQMIRQALRGRWG